MLPTILLPLKQTEHRPLIEEYFPTQLDRIEFWEIHDIDCAGPEETIPHLEREGVGIIERLEGSND